MDKKKLTTVSDFLDLENVERYGADLESYDFKFLMLEYYDYWNEKSRSQARYTDLMENIGKQIGSSQDKNEGITNISRWFAYKTLDVEYARDEKISFLFFDCDNSNDTCALTKEIYDTLWGWKKENASYFGNAFVWEEEDAALGGDTMNSFATTMKQYFMRSEKNIMSVEDCKEKYNAIEKDEVQEIGFEDFAKYVSCIGNFVLVPAGFNGYRGIHKCLKDYWDLSLDYLAYAKSSWLQSGEKGIEQNKGFNRYINTFFLWDYVTAVPPEAGSKYEVKPLFDSHKSKLGGGKELSKEGIYPDKDCEFKQFLENVNHYIKRRGRFMTAMLRIAVLPEEEKADEKPEWKGWKVSGIYKKIMKEVFLTDTVYSDYEQVIEKIENVTKNINIVADVQDRLIEILSTLKDNLEDKKN